MASGFRKFIILFLLLFATGELFAQHIVIDAIEISTPSRTGESKLPAYSNFIENTKSPTLFRTQRVAELSRTNRTTRNGLAIDFIFRLKSNPKHQFIGGFESATFNSELYDLLGIFQDSLSVSTNLSSKMEFFFLKAGYNYARTPGKRFTFIAGAILNIGIPVSAKTTEEISTSDFFLGNQEFSFFAKQSASFGLNVPVGVRLKVIKNISLSFVINPGFQYQRIDGNPVLTSFQGANFGFYFNLKDR